MGQHNRLHFQEELVKKLLYAAIVTWLPFKGVAVKGVDVLELEREVVDIVQVVSGVSILRICAGDHVLGVSGVLPNF